MVYGYLCINAMPILFARTKVLLCGGHHLANTTLSSLAHVDYAFTTWPLPPSSSVSITNAASTPYASLAAAETMMIYCSSVARGKK